MESLIWCLEKLIRKDGWLNNQLIWCVVRYSLLAVHQCGHKNQLRLLIIYLKCAIQSCFVERKHMVTIFFYFKKQLDTPCFWYNLEAQHLKTAHFMAILRKPAEIHWKFFSEHTFCVSTGESISLGVRWKMEYLKIVHSVEHCLPSSTHIFKGMDSIIGKCLYNDNLTLFLSSLSMMIIEYKWRES